MIKYLSIQISWQYNFSPITLNDQILERSNLLAIQFLAINIERPNIGTFKSPSNTNPCQQHCASKNLSTLTKSNN
uniref:Uncharacterized protein n=1 Tax=viral metagenome TaxID=1070528 RepID=A0A6C0C8V3_9ZZZZ